MPTSPTSPSALPTPPSTTDPANFDARADAFFAALAANQTQVNALSTNVYNNALEVAANAVTVATSEASTSASAAAAASYAGASPWAAGTYALSAVVYSPVNRKLYRKSTTNSFTSTDPNADSVNWSAVKVSRPIVTVVTSGVSAAHGFDYLLTFAGAVTVTAMASPANEDTFGILVANGRSDNVLNPNSNTIFGTSGNMTIDDTYAQIEVRFLNSTYRVSK